MWHMTCDMWHVTCDMTHHMWHFVGDEHSLKFQVPSFYGSWFRISWRLGLTESIIDKGVCRTAPATPGLLNTRFSQSCFTSTFVIHSFINSSFSSKSWDNFTPRTVWARDLKFEIIFTSFHMSHVTCSCHVLHVTCRVSDLFLAT